MEHYEGYQREDVIFEIVVWLFVLAIVYIDIKATFQ